MDERELLMEKINAIQREIERHNYARSEEEKAFSDAAEDSLDDYIASDRNRKFINRRK